MNRDLPHAQRRHLRDRRSHVIGAMSGRSVITTCEKPAKEPSNEAAQIPASAVRRPRRSARSSPPPGPRANRGRSRSGRVRSNRPGHDLSRTSRRANRNDDHLRLPDKENDQCPTGFINADVDRNAAGKVIGSDSLNCRDTGPKTPPKCAVNVDLASGDLFPDHDSVAVEGGRQRCHRDWALRARDRDSLGHSSFEHTDQHHRHTRQSRDLVAPPRHVEAETWATCGSRWPRRIVSLHSLRCLGAPSSMTR